MRMKKLAATAAVTGVALITPAIALPADAAVVTVHDKTGDAKKGDAQGDLAYVRVRYAPHALNIRIQWAKGGYPGESEEVLLDTRPGDPGPEVDITADMEGTWQVQVRHWNRPGWTTTSTGRAHYHLGKAPYATLSIPRKAIKRKGHAQPTRIRARAAEWMEGEGIVDRVPGGNRFGPWIKWK